MSSSARDLLARLTPRYAALGAIGALTLYGAIQAVARTTGKLRTEVDTIIVHAVSGPRCEGGRVVYSGAPGDTARWKRFFDTHPFLSIHYIVDRAGTVLASTPENQEANHALHNNQGSIGIELVHNGDGIEQFGHRQIGALIGLIRSIRTRHRIPIQNIKSHAEVDKRTFVCGAREIKSRQDPGGNFPWAILRDALNDDDAPGEPDF